MRAIDTNVLVRVITRDDPKLAARADEFVAPGAWVSHLALVETTWVLAAVYRLAPTKLAMAVELLLSHQSLSIQDPEVVLAALEHFRAKPSLGFSDCLLLAVAQAAGHGPLGTFDRDLAKLPGTQRL